MTPASPDSTRGRGRIIALLVALSFWSHFNRTCLPVAAPAIQREYGLTKSQLGLVYSTLLMCYVICMTPGGWFSDRFGARLALTIMGIGTGLACVLTGVAGQLAVSGVALLAMLFAVRGLMGVALAPTYPAAGRVVSNWVPFQQRALTNALVTSAYPAGMAGAHIFFALLADRIGWKQAFMAFGVLTFLTGVVWWRFGRDKPPDSPVLLDLDSPATAAPIEGAGTSPNWLRMLRHRSLLLLTLSYAAVGYLEYLFVYWSKFYFEKVLKLTEDQNRWANVALAFAFGLGMLTGGRISDALLPRLGHRWARASVGLIGMTASALFLAAGALPFQSSIAALACFAISNYAIGVCEAAAWTTAIELGGRWGATSAAIANTGGNAGGMLSPYFTPVLAAYLEPRIGEAAAWQWGVGLGSLVCLAGAMLWWRIDAGDTFDDEQTD